MVILRTRGVSQLSLLLMRWNPDITMYQGTGIESGNHFVLPPIFMIDMARFGHVALSYKEPTLVILGLAQKVNSIVERQRG